MVSLPTSRSPSYRVGTSCYYGPNKPVTKVETPVSKILEITQQRQLTSVLYDHSVVP